MRETSCLATAPFSTKSIQVTCGLSAPRGAVWLNRGSRFDGLTMGHRARLATWHSRFSQPFSTTRNETMMCFRTRWLGAHTVVAPRGSPPSSPSPRSGARAHGARASDARVRLGERVRAEGRTRRPAAIDGAHSSRGSAGSHDGRKARPARLPRPASTRGPHRVSRHPQARLGWILGRERRRRRRGFPRPADAQRLARSRISRRDLRGTPAPGRGADARQRGLRHALQRGGLGEAAEPPPRRQLHVRGAPARRVPRRRALRAAAQEQIPHPREARVSRGQAELGGRGRRAAARPAGGLRVLAGPRGGGGGAGPPRAEHVGHRRHGAHRGERGRDRHGGGGDAREGKRAHLRGGRDAARFGDPRRHRLADVRGHHAEGREGAGVLPGEGREPKSARGVLQPLADGGAEGRHRQRHARGEERPGGGPHDLRACTWSARSIRRAWRRARRTCWI